MSFTYLFIYLQKILYFYWAAYIFIWKRLYINWAAGIFIRISTLYLSPVGFGYKEGYERKSFLLIATHIFICQNINPRWAQDCTRLLQRGWPWCWCSWSWHRRRPATSTVPPRAPPCFSTRGCRRQGPSARSRGWCESFPSLYFYPMIRRTTALFQRSSDS